MGEKGLPCRSPAEGQSGIEEIGEKGLAFADQKEIEEVGEGFGVQGDGDAAADDERVALAPRTGFEGNPRHLENPQDVGIVVFEGEGEGDDVEIGQGPLRFEAEERGG